MFTSVATPHRLWSAAVLVALATLPRITLAQSAAEHVAMGDRENAAMNAAGALQHYEAAVKADPKAYDANWKAASTGTQPSAAATRSASASTRRQNYTRGVPSRRIRATPRGTSIWPARWGAKHCRSACASG